jgi:cytochrome c2
MPTLRTRATAAFTVLALVIIAVCLAFNQAWKLADVRHKAEALTGGNVERGRQAFIGAGCGGCHTLEGVTQANGLVGPPLDGIAERAVIAGVLANNPGNMSRWISSPQSVVPGNAMPDMQLSTQQTSDIAAFLYTRT